MKNIFSWIYFIVIFAPYKMYYSFIDVYQPYQSSLSSLQDSKVIILGLKYKKESSYGSLKESRSLVYS